MCFLFGTSFVDIVAIVTSEAGFSLLRTPDYSTNGASTEHATGDLVGTCSTLDH